MRLLIADDAPLSREIIRRILSKESVYEAVYVEDGEQAWDLLRENPAAFDAAILDVTMPVLGGLEVLARMRGHPALRTMPVILCTALGDRVTVEHAARLAVEHYIIKPYVRSVLLGRLALVRASLGMGESGPRGDSVSDRLGLSPSVCAELQSQLRTHTRAWLAEAAVLGDGAALGRFALSANGLRGSALALGETVLARRLDEAEQRILSLCADREIFPRELRHGEVSALVWSVANWLSEQGDYPAAS